METMTAAAAVTVEEHLAKLRQEEAIFCRFELDGDPQPGDHMALAQSDLVKDTRANRERLKGVRIRTERSGTAKQWKETPIRLQDARTYLKRVRGTNDPKIAELQRQIEALQQQNYDAQVAVNTLSEQLKVMTDNRQLLESDMLLPSLILKEIALLINQAGARQKWNALTREAEHLERNGHAEDAQQVRAEIAAMLDRFPAEIKRHMRLLREFYTSQIE